MSAGKCRNNQRNDVGKAWWLTDGHEVVVIEKYQDEILAHSTDGLRCGRGWTSGLPRCLGDRSRCRVQEREAGGHLILGRRARKDLLKGIAQKCFVVLTCGFPEIGGEHLGLRERERLLSAPPDGDAAAIARSGE